MGQAASRRDTMTKLLRTVYMPRMHEQFPLGAITLQIFKAHNQNLTQGEKLSFPLHMNTGGGPILTDHNLALPTPMEEDVDRAEYTYQGLTDAFNVAASFIDDTSTSKAAEKKILDFQTTALRKRNARTKNFLMYGDGSGLFATLSAASSATSFTVSNAAGLRNGWYDVVLIADGTVVGGSKAIKLSINRTTGVCTVSTGALSDWSTVNAAPTTYGVYTPDGFEQAVFGFDAFVNDANPSRGNVGGIDRTDASKINFTSYVDRNGSVGRDLSFSTIQDCQDEIVFRSDSGAPDLVLCHPTSYKKLVAEIETKKRYTGNTTDVKGWSDALRVAGISAAVVKDHHCPKDKAFILNTSTWLMAQNDDGKFQENAGSMLIPMDSGHIGYRSAWWQMYQPVCLEPAANAVIHDLTTS